MARNPQPSKKPVYGPSIRPSKVVDRTDGGVGERPGVQHVHNDLIAVLPIYCLIMDCIKGEVAVKQHDRHWGNFTGTGYVLFDMPEFSYSNLYNGSGAAFITKYLPQPNPTDSSQENNERYRDYITRAVFYNVTGHTLETFVGAIFLRAPIIELPTSLANLKDDISGNGVSLVQSAKAAVHAVMAYGRAGVLADFPAVRGPVTQAQRLSGEARATLTLYEPWRIINWRSKWIGGLQKLTLVVLAEPGLADDDGFKQTTTEQYRVLRLVNNVYQVEIWRRKGGVGDGTGAVELADTYQPRDAVGAIFEYIPFKFIGPQDNTPNVDKAPMADIAHLNIGHYRNSADYEESVYQCGQPTLAVSGLTQEWVTEVLGGRVLIGSRVGLTLPVDGKAEMIQADPNNLAGEAMLSKETQMRALGAKLIEENRVQKTATEAGHDEAAAQSVLASSAANVSQAYLWALQQMCRFEGETFTKETLKFELNTELDLIKPSPESRKQWLTEWQAGGITWLEYRHNLRRAGIAFVDDDEAKKEIDANPPPNIALEKEAIQKTATNDRTSP